MKCTDIEAYFQNVAPYVDWDNTTDRFKAGDPEREINTVAVAWKATWDALREAHSRGAELFISHESICVRADNTDPGPEVAFALPSEMPKFDWLSETGMTVFRCHDTWDRFPDLGIRWTWQRGLELGGVIVSDEYPLLITEIPPRALSALASHILDRIRPLGQNGIPVWGDLDKQVHRVASGTGVTVMPNAMIDLGADVGIFTDDYFQHVRAGAHARELDFPGIVVNHGVSEEWGMVTLANHVAETFPNLNVFHIPQRCAYTIMTG